MKIVILAHFAGSPIHGMVYGHYYLAREWVRLGHDVTIVASSFAHTRLSQPEVTAPVTEQWIDGIRYLWVKCPRYDAARKFGRVWNIAVYVARNLWSNLPIDHADLVICSSHHPFAILPARKLSLRFSAKLVFEVRDIWPLTLIELSGISPGHPFIRFMQWAEDFAYRVADSVVSVLPKAETHMVSRGMSPDKYLYIPNGVDLDTEPADVLPADYLSTLHDLKKQNKFLVGYAGRMGIVNALCYLVEAVAILDNPEIHLCLLGDGYELENLKIQVKKRGIEERVHFFPAVPKVQVKSFLQCMDVLYVGFLDKSIYQYGTSITKINDYMLAAKPVLCSIDGCIEGVKESGSGIVCPPEDVQEIASSIKNIYHFSSDYREKMGKSGRDWIIANRDYKTLAKQFLKYV